MILNILLYLLQLNVHANAISAASYMSQYISYKYVGKALEEINADKLLYRVSDKTDIKSDMNKITKGLTMSDLFSCL